MRSDLGRILRGEKYVTVGCHQCSTIPIVRHTKTTAIRIARRHAAGTGHTVRLYIEHYQDVAPKEEDR